MVTYIVVDTCVLSDIIKQYNPSLPDESYTPSRFLSTQMLQLINPIVANAGEDGYIIASTFAFVELLNKYSEIFNGTTVTIARIKAFMLQPPSWFIVENMTSDTAKYFCDIPTCTPKFEPISSDDAVHIATAMQRGDEVTFLTSDSRMTALSIPRLSFVE